MSAAATPTTRPSPFANATPKQRDFIRDLLAKVPQIVQDKAIDWAAEQCLLGDGTLNRAQVHGLITRLVAVRDAQKVFEAEQPPESRPAGQSYPDVEAGRYALATDGVVHFYQVQRPTEGKYVGRTFLQEQHSDSHTRVMGPAAASVLRRIEADPKAATILYGQELGVCGKCGRTLTSEWRREGIGPICSQSF